MKPFNLHSNLQRLSLIFSSDPKNVHFELLQYVQSDLTYQTLVRGLKPSVFSCENISVVFSAEH